MLSKTSFGSKDTAGGVEDFDMDDDHEELPDDEKGDRKLFYYQMKQFFLIRSLV